MWEQKQLFMKSLIINNSKGLIAILDQRVIKYDVIYDGSKLKIFYTDAEDLFEIGKFIGASLPNLIPA